MSGKLDQSLDEIISTQRRSNVRAKGGRHVRRPGRSVAVNPAAGVRKNPKASKGTLKPVPTGPSSVNSNGKILVTGLPRDVNEGMIKEYFMKQVGPIKRVEISYGPGGVSRGVANITFARAESAIKAVDECNNVSIDGKPIKIELILDATRAKAIPPPKGLSERVTHKPRPKPATNPRPAAVSASRGGKASRGGHTNRNARPVKKTAEELDSEMIDYWQNGSTAAENTAGNSGAPATNGDANMDDEIL
ncbi:mRNA export protein mlo3 [Golovinomyces cichoracearum]|uniref:mRNA export protein mlo3 n=1 Tax=Golovinomyces cichoracearum TaxID=62708 RepID=A0A420IX27_9PEZI|nr:mRNA export protein mlo3 [Golovinomyces cichoracearum]